MAANAISIGKLVLIIGDFNVTVSSEEKRGGRRFSESRDILEFKNFIRDARLINLGYSGNQFFIV